MQLLFDRKSRAESVLVTIFIICIFYGDVHLLFVVPLSIIALPVLMAFVLIKRCSLSFGISAGVVLLSGLLSVVAIQFLIGMSPPMRSDLSVYGPIVYAILTAFTLSFFRISDTTIWRSLMLGGMVTAATMIYMLTFAPDGQYAIPGQDFAVTDHEFRQSRSPNRDMTQYQSKALVTPGETDDTSVKQFYETKNKIRNALGRSNYIAVFFVLLFCVALFRRNWLYVAVFSLFTALTLSRFGMVALVVVMLIWFIHHSKISSKTIICGTTAITVFVVATFSIWPNLLNYLPGYQSLEARLSFWQSGLQVATDHYLFGAPRTAILDQYGYSIIWNPHNFLIWVVSIFGMFGLTFYITYVFIALREIYLRAKASQLWNGILVALAVSFFWSLFEIVAFTPAFEIFLAAMYSLARGQNREAYSSGGADSQYATPSIES